MVTVVVEDDGSVQSKFDEAIDIHNGSIASSINQFTYRQPRIRLIQSPTGELRFTLFQFRPDLTIAPPDAYRDFTPAELVEITTSGQQAFIAAMVPTSGGFSDSAILPFLKIWKADALPINRPNLVILAAVRWDKTTTTLRVMLNPNTTAGVSITRQSCNHQWFHSTPVSRYDDLVWKPEITGGTATSGMIYSCSSSVDLAFFSHPCFPSNLLVWKDGCLEDRVTVVSSALSCVRIDRNTIKLMNCTGVQFINLVQGDNVVYSTLIGFRESYPHPILPKA